MTGCFRFGEFELDLGAYVLRRSGDQIRLEKIPMEMLRLLIANAGRLVERREIHVALWGREVFVERDAAINTAVRKIRSALHDDPDAPRYVETVVGKGYKFIAAVERLSSKAKGKTDGPRPSSVRWRRGFPSYTLTRGRQEFVLDSGDNVIGRDPAAGIYVDHAAVSRRHACVIVDGERVFVDDLKSRNGTFVNGRRIHAPTPLSHGAVIGLGPITLTFIALSAPGSTAPLSSGSTAVSSNVENDR